MAAIRLGPDEDPFTALRDLQARTGARAMAMVTCVGSLTRAMIRHADQPEAREYLGRYEITSLVGTIDPLRAHLHLGIADGEGRGVVIEAEGKQLHGTPGSGRFCQAAIISPHFL